MFEGMFGKKKVVDVEKEPEAVVPTAESNVVNIRQSNTVVDANGNVIGAAESEAEARRKYTQNAIDQREAA